MPKLETEHSCQPSPPPNNAESAEVPAHPELGLTVLALYHGVVVFLPEADVAQVKNPRHQLKNRVLLVGRQTHHRHGLLGDRK